MPKFFLSAVIVFSLSIMTSCAATISGDPSKSKMEQIEKADQADAELERTAK